MIAHADVVRGAQATEIVCRRDADSARDCVGNQFDSATFSDSGHSGRHDIKGYEAVTNLCHTSVALRRRGGVLVRVWVRQWVSAFCYSGGRCGCRCSQPCSGIQHHSRSAMAVSDPVS